MSGAVRKIIRAYQLVISPLLPGQCRFTPSCSQYAMDAVERRGMFKGLFLIVFRVLRCQPFCEGGLDEVKENG